jgi:flagellar hook-associated protein 2
MSSISVNTGSGSPTSITGLASGFDTAAIIKALVEAERVPITKLTTQQEKLTAQGTQLRSLQLSLQNLTFSLSEFNLPSLYETSQTATSSEPLRVAAVATSGAGVGGYQVEVTRLANSAQRTFTFTSPAAEDTVNIDGHEYKLAAGGTAKELAQKINADGTATVYAAVVNSETLVFSARQTGATEGEFIKVTDSAGALVEKAGTAKEGKDAEYSVDGIAGKSATNVVTEAIPGVKLTLEGVTTTSGPVTVDVSAPAANTSGIEEQLQAFVSAYNSTVEGIQKQLTTKPVAGASNAKEFEVGTLFGDNELTLLVARMRTTIYESGKELPAGMASPFDIGVTTGAATASASAQSAVEGHLKLTPGKLAAALAENPEGVEKMLRSWATALKGVINNAAEPGGGLDTRVEGDQAQITNLKARITTMNEQLAIRQKALVQTYAQLESALARNNAQLSWLQQQTESLSKSGG